MLRNKVLLLTAVLSLTLACTLPTIGAPSGQAPSDAPAAQPGDAPLLPGFKLPGSTTPPSDPVSISEGLASLNSYRSTISVTVKGPDPLSSSTIVYETQRSKDQDASYTNMTSSNVKKGVAAEPGAGGGNEVYTIGNDRCMNSSGEWSWQSMTPNQAEMMDLAMSMINFTPLIDKPTFVAAETVNGIPTNHFTFKISTLGIKSGAEVTANQGDYWLAVDGQYIVKYTLVAETVVDSQTNMFHMETLIDIKDINQPVDIAFPQTCLDAKLATPEPSPAP